MVSFAYIKKGIAAFSKQEKDLLIKLYISENLTAKQVASKLSISTRTLYLRLRAHGITKGMQRGLPKAIKYCEHCGQVMPKSKYRIQRIKNNID